MKKRIFFAFTLPLFLLILSCEKKSTNPTEAITITLAQFKGFFDAGKYFQFYVDTTSQMVNVGNQGADNTYNFSGLPFFNEGLVSMIPLTSIPELTNRYPANSFALQIPGGPGEYDYPIFTYTTDSLLNPGDAQFSSNGDKDYGHTVPADIFVRFPLTFDDQWSIFSTYRDTTYNSGGTPISNNSGSSTRYHRVDGWGTLKLPGVADKPCVRIQTYESPSGNTTEFFYFTADGYFIRVAATGTVSSGNVTVKPGDPILYGVLTVPIGKVIVK